MELYGRRTSDLSLYIFQTQFHFIILSLFSTTIFIPYGHARSGPLPDPDDYDIVTSAPQPRTATEGNMTAVASKFRDVFVRNRGARREEVLSALESGFKPVKLSSKRDPRAEEATFGDGYNLGYVPGTGEKGTYVASTGSGGKTNVLSVSASTSSKDAGPPSAASAFDELDGQSSDTGYEQNGVDSGWSNAKYKGSSGKYAKAGYTAAASSYGDSYGGWGSGGDSYGGGGGYGGGSDSYGGGSSYGGWGGDGQDNTLVYALAIKLKQLREDYDYDIAARDAYIANMNSGSGGSRKSGGLFGR